MDTDAQKLFRRLKDLNDDLFTLCFEHAERQRFISGVTLLSLFSVLTIPIFAVCFSLGKTPWSDFPLVNLTIFAACACAICGALKFLLERKNTKLSEQIYSLCESAKAQGFHLVWCYSMVRGYYYGAYIEVSDRPALVDPDLRYDCEIDLRDYPTSASLMWLLSHGRPKVLYED